MRRPFTEQACVTDGRPARRRPINHPLRPDHLKRLVDITLKSGLCARNRTNQVILASEF